MRIRKVRTIDYVTITETPPDKKEYLGKSFERVDGSFKDWLNGNNVTGYLTELTPFTFKTDKGFDIELFDGSITETINEFVMNRLYQKLLIQYGELQYSYVNTEMVGIPYLNKKTKAEMDLILRNEITNTEGVEKIIEFNSTVENRVYHLDFKVKTTEGDILWLTVDQ